MVKLDDLKENDRIVRRISEMLEMAECFKANSEVELYRAVVSR